MVAPGAIAPMSTQPFSRCVRSRNYRGTAGNLDAAILRRDEGEESHFLTVTRWESENAIRAFAGSELLKAKYYDEDRDFLLEFEDEVQHYSVVARASAAGD